MKPQEIDSKKQEIIDRACSKIIWGDRDWEVLEFLEKQGIHDEGEAEEILRIAHKERKSIIRKKALVWLIAGVIGTVVCGVLSDKLMGLDIPARQFGTFRLMLIGGFFASLGCTAKGISLLISGKKMGSAMDD